MQQAGYDDLQLLPQQLMYKQLQELQRQQRHHRGQEQKQQNSLNHISVLSRQEPANQLSTLVNGVPLSDTTNCSWQNEFTGSDLKAYGNSQMSLVGNMNVAQHGVSSSVHGLIVSHDQGQVSRSMGFVPQQSDQFYDMPISTTRTNQYSQFQGIPQDFAVQVSKADVNQTQKLSIESAAHNSFQSIQNLYGNQSGLQSGILSSEHHLQGKKMFGLVAGDSLNGNAGGNFQQTNTIARASDGQQVNIRHDHSNCSGTSKEKEARPSEKSQVSVGLDPTEERILFSSDDDINWDPSLGKSIMGMGGMQGNHLEGSDLFSSFPPIQSGSWSALMQSAVAEFSGGDVGLQDEWNGLSFQKAESSSGKHTATLNDSMKQQTAWFHNSLPSAASLPCRSVPLENGELQSSGLRSEEKIRIGPQNMEGPWSQQQNVMSYTLNSPTQDKGNGWNINGQHSSNFEASFRVPAGEPSTRSGFTNNSMKLVHADKNHSDKMWNFDENQVVASASMVGPETSKSGICFPQMQTSVSMNSNSSKGNYEMNIQGAYQHEFQYGKHPPDSSLSSQGNENMRNNQQKLNRSPQMWESSLSNSDKVSGENCNRTKEHGSQRELSNDSYMSSHSHPDHSSDSVGGARDNFPLSGANSYSFPSGIQQIHGQLGHDMFAQRLRYHPIGNSVSEYEKKGSQEQVVHAQGVAQMVARGFKSPDQRSLQQAVTSSPLNMEMRLVNCSQSDAKGTAELHAECNNGPGHKLPVSFGKSAVMFPQRSQPCQTGQDMLEHLRKVDQSREDDNDTTVSSFSDQDTPSQRNEGIISEGLAAYPQLHQASAFSGSGLQLAPASQWQSTSDRNLSPIFSGTVNKLKPTHNVTEVEEQKTSWSSSAVPVQMYNWDLRKSFARQTAKEASQSNVQADSSMAAKAGDLSYMRNQLQQQSNGHTAINYPDNTSPKAQYDWNNYNAYSSLQQKNDANGSIAVSQQPLLGMSCTNLPCRLASPSEGHSIAHSTGVSQSDYVNSQGQSQPVTADSFNRISGQQLDAADTGHISQTSMAYGMPQHGGISGTPHNLWTNISTERLSSSVSQNTTSVPMQSVYSDKFDVSSWHPLKSNYQDQNDGKSIPSNFGLLACNSPNVDHAKVHSGQVGLKQQVGLARNDNTPEFANTPQGQESIPNQASDVKSIHLDTSSVHLHQNEKHGRDSDNHNLLIDQSTAMNDSPYSLLQQVQAMKAFEVNSNNRASKRLKGTEAGLDQQLTGKALMFYGSNMVGKAPADDLSAVVHHGSFPTDTRMLSFSPDGTKQQNASKPLVGGKEMNQDLGTSWQTISPNYPHSINVQPNNFPSGIRAEDQHVHFNPQMTPTWFAQYGNLQKSGPAMTGGLSCNSQNNAKMAAEHYSLPKCSESMPTQRILEGKSDVAIILNDQLASLQEFSSWVPGHDVSKSKKRKSATSDLLPWHSEIMVGSGRLQNIRMAERDWAQTTNRLVEKVENQAYFRDDGHVVPRARRRLMLTTQLMQQLLPSIPTTILSKPACSVYEHVIYLVAKLSLGDACGLVSCLRMDSCGLADAEDRISGKSKASDRSGGQFFLKLMENFVGRAMKLETDLNRLEKRPSILDIKVECQDLEKFAIINRFAKFHGRSRTDAEGSSSEASRNTFVHRYVSALNMSGNVPDGVVCLSL